MKNQDQQALDEFKAHIMSPEGKQSLSESLDEWFTMGEICEQVNEEYPDSTDEEFINECLKRYDIIFSMNDVDMTSSFL